MVPVSMGSSILAQGMYTLLDDIIKYFPSPDKRSCTGINAKSNEVYSADYDFSKPKSAYIFKTIVDPFIGKYSLIKVNSGVLKTDDLLFNHHRDTEGMDWKALCNVRQQATGSTGASCRRYRSISKAFPEL